MRVKQFTPIMAKDSTITLHRPRSVSWEKSPTGPGSPRDAPSTCTVSTMSMLTMRNASRLELLVKRASAILPTFYYKTLKK